MGGLAEIDAYLRRLCDVLAETLGERLLAVYALGGLALGEYRRGSSDVDVYVIVAARLDDAGKRSIARACCNDALACPARELEMVVITAAAASSPAAAPRWELNLNTGRDRADHVGTDPTREPAFWFVLDLAIARQSALTLAGPDARDLIGSPPHAVLAAAQADAVAWYARNATVQEAGVAACRAWHWHETGAFVGKRGRTALGGRTRPRLGCANVAGWHSEVRRRAVDNRASTCSGEGATVNRAASRSGAAGLVLVAMTLANAMILVDQTAVPITLPAIMNGFHVGSQKVQWVLNGSLLPLAGLLVLGGKLGDLLGRRRVFIVGAVTFAGASAVGGLAPLFGTLLAARVLQGVGGALMLPTSVAIVSAAFSPRERGRALGTMGGAAAIAGALGPTIGGVLTSALSWRAVLLVNTPLAAACVVATLRAVEPDAPRQGRPHVDVSGAVLICIALVGITFGLSQTQLASWRSVSVVLPLAAGVSAAAALVVNERRAPMPLLDFRLLSRHHNYLGATVSQGLAGLGEMGLSVIFPLVLILNLGMTPGLAGLALLPSTVPMVVVSPLAGRWYDRVGGRTPLLVGFGTLAASGVALALAMQGGQTYLELLPGLLLFGIGLAFVLTVNDPVSLDSISEEDQGQASGVSATAEQGGGAVGIAVCYTLFHTAYVNRLHELINRSPLPDLNNPQYRALRAGLLHAESTGLRASQFNPKLTSYLEPAQAASGHGYAVAFLTVSVASLLGLVAVAAFVRRPPARRPPSEPAVVIEG